MSVPQIDPQHHLPLITYSYKEVHSNVKRYIDSYNAKFEDSENHSIHPSRSPVNSNERATADHLVRICLNQLHQNGQGYSVSDKEGPSLHTYTPSLAKLRGCSGKTIQNHRKKLIESGIIVKEDGHGKNGLRIYLNPELVYKIDVENHFKGTSQNKFPAEKSPMGFNKTKNLHPLPQDLQDLEHNISHVDMCRSAVLDRLSETSACDKQDHYKTKEQDGPEKEKGSDQLKHPDKNSKRKAKREPQRDSSQQQKRFRKDLVVEFWIHARHMIYPNEKFADHDLKAIKNLIWHNIFKGFPPEISEKEFRTYLHICKERLTMAQKWIENHPNFITLPPHLYFGSKKKAGTFYQTWDWYVNSQRKKEWNKIFAEAKKFRKGNLQFIRNGNKYTPTVHELYYSHLERLKEFGDQVAISVGPCQGFRSNSATLKDAAK